MNSNDRLTSLLALVQSTFKSSHAQHLLIRTRRAHVELLRAMASSSHSLLDVTWTRLRGRLEELEEAGREAAFEGRDSAPIRVAEEARGVINEVEVEVKEIMNQAGARHSRSSSGISMDELLPRKAPQAASSSSHPSTSTLDSFLSQTNHSFPSFTVKATTRHTQLLAEAYTLHLLATNPSSVLPAGKTIGSLFRTIAPSAAPVMGVTEKRVTELVHDAYFDDLGDVLKDGTDLETRAKWQQLKEDLWDACQSLISSKLGGGKVRQDLEAEFSPSLSASMLPPFDLGSATFPLRHLLSTLASLCAPSRDQEIASVIFNISTSSPISPSDLVHAVRATLHIASGMRNDLKSFQVGLASAVGSEEDFKDIINMGASRRERNAVLGLYGVDSGGSIEKVTDAMLNWLGAEKNQWGIETVAARAKLVAVKLVETLFDNRAIAIPSFGLDSSPIPIDATVANFLPPILIVPSPRLFRIQNLLQAVIILAAMLSLVNASVSSPPPPPSSSTPEWVRRIWIVLRSEVDSAHSSSSRDAGSETKLDHLVDEVLVGIQTQQGVANSKEEEDRIREGVKRILRYEDPVYQLLKKRLAAAFEKEWVEMVSVPRKPQGQGIISPPGMRSGRVVGTGLGSPSISKPETAVPTKTFGSVKGFEKLSEEIAEVRGELEAVYLWSRSVWGELLGF